MNLEELDYLLIKERRRQENNKVKLREEVPGDKTKQHERRRGKESEHLTIHNRNIFYAMN